MADREEEAGRPAPEHAPEHAGGEAVGQDGAQPGAQEAVRKKPLGWLSWAVAVAGWLICAILCLWLTIALEAWPYAYEVFFPAIVLILFCNILVFLFVATRWASLPRRLFGAVARVCFGEGLLLLLMYGAGRYAIGG